MLSPLRAAASLSEISRSSSNGLLVRRGVNQSPVYESAERRGCFIRPTGG